MAIKIEIHKLKPNGDTESIWKLNEWLEYNKSKTSTLIKNIVRKEKDQSTQEQYIVILLERILEDFAEPHYGYLRVNIGLNKIHLDNGNLTVEDKIKFYFWINVFGVCNIAKVDEQKVFQNYRQFNFKAPGRPGLGPSKQQGQTHSKRDHGLQCSEG